MDLSDAVALIDEAEITAATARSQLSDRRADANNLAVQRAAAVSKDGAKLAATTEAWSAIGERFAPQMTRYNTAVENAREQLRKRAD